MIFKQILTFPDLPNVTAGVFVAEKSLLVTGHQNGLIIKWNTKDKTYELLYKCPSEIKTISWLDDKKIVAGSHAGNLLIIDVYSPKDPEILQEATYDVHTRVWRTLSPESDRVITSSTYGVVNLLRKQSKDQWEKVSLSGHSNSVFGLGGYDGKLIASGDYRGNILIWKPEGPLFKIIQRLNINQSVEDIAWHKEEILATISRTGRISLFEKLNPGTEQWQLVFDIDNASSYGNCIHITEDGKTVYAGTENEIIQFDRDSQQVGLIDLKATVKIFFEGNQAYVLTKTSFQSFERTEIAVPASSIKYRYAKISLVGHTGVGKSTLCNFITTGSPGKVKSTFGKRVWIWPVTSEDKLDKRIIFHDHGGQETVIGTFLPLIADSDIILILFQKNDRGTFTTALETLDQLRRTLNPKTKIFFVQTYIDEDVQDFNEEILKKILSDKKIDGHFEICPPAGLGIDALKTALINNIPWENARIMIQSQYSDAAMKAITMLNEKEVNVIQFEDLRGYYSEILGTNVPVRHLKFLLRDLSNQGIIDYDPQVSSLVIINDEEFNKLRTNVPIFVETKNGIVSMDELFRNFGHREYLTILDSVYQNYKISIRNRERRIFPEKLRKEKIALASSYKSDLEAKEPYKKLFREQTIEISRLIEALSELNLNCIDISQTDGLFSWDEFAFVYYSFFPEGNSVRGLKVGFEYYLGGTKNETIIRLKKEFESIIESLFGPSLGNEVNQIKKKVLKQEETKFDAALSFAGEQRDYVEQVASILTSKGIKVFYDEFFQAQLWGTNLAEYLHRVYYSDSNFCIMFVSKEYVSKAWPTHERRSAIAKQIEIAGVREYILPVVFDDLEVPGLQLSNIGYLDSRKETPEKVANLFIKKNEDIKKLGASRPNLAGT